MLVHNNRAVWTAWVRHKIHALTATTPLIALFAILTMSSKTTHALARLLINNFSSLINFNAKSAPNKLSINAANAFQRVNAWLALMAVRLPETFVSLLSGAQWAQDPWLKLFAFSAIPKSIFSTSHKLSASAWRGITSMQISKAVNQNAATGFDWKTKTKSATMGIIWIETAAPKFARWKVDTFALKMTMTWAFARELVESP